MIRCLNLTGVDFYLGQIEEKFAVSEYTTLGDLLSDSADIESVLLVLMHQLDTTLLSQLSLAGQRHVVMFNPMVPKDADSQPSEIKGIVTLSVVTVLENLLPELVSATDRLEKYLKSKPMRIRVISSEPPVQGRVLCGSLGSKAEPLRWLPEGKQVLVEKLSQESADHSRISLQCLDNALAPGDLLCGLDAPCEISDQFSVQLFWFSQEPCYLGRTYDLEQNNRKLTATVTDIKYRLDAQSGDQQPARQIRKNEFGQVSLNLSSDIVFDTQQGCQPLSQLLLRDRTNGEVLGWAGIQFALRRAANVHKQSLTVDKLERAKTKGHTGRVVWFTGLSGSGKSTIANALEQALHAQGKHTYILDGDNVRHGLNKDLGFTDADRVENIRRISEVAKLMVDAGLIVLTAFISPFRSERDMAREMFEANEFVEVFVDVPLDVAEQRDPKGLYKKARQGQLPNFTGIDSAYEPPLSAEYRVATHEMDVDEAVKDLLDLLDT